ncbi:MAG: PAS domain-containing protein [Bdellovibrionales bacterium]|nr:PAS domain-containing protein [Bdellovibrionales bacterium]
MSNEQSKGNDPIGASSPTSLSTRIEVNSGTSSSTSDQLTLSDALELLDLSSSGVACFRFSPPIQLTLPEDIFCEALWKSQSRCIHANVRFLQAHGAHSRRQAIENYTFSSFFPRDTDSEGLVREFARNHGILHNYEYRLRNGGRENHYRLVSLYPILDEGRIEKLWLVYRDLIDSSKAIEKLKEAEEHYRTLVERPGLVLTRVRPDNTYIYVSPHAVEIIGKSLEDFESEPFLLRSYIHPDDRERHDAIYDARKYLRKEPVELEYRVLCADGQYRWFVERQTAKLDENGQIEYFDCVTMSIQEKKNLEQELIQAERMRTLGNLAASVAHQFDEHVNNILTDLTQALRETPKNTPLFQRIERAERGALLCAEISKRLILFGKRDIKAREVLSVKRLVQETETYLSFLLREGIALTIELAQDLPPIRGNVAYLQQVLILLAVRASRSIGENGTISLRVRDCQLSDERPTAFYPNAHPGKYVEFEVSDDGVGIPPHEMAQLFHPDTEIDDPYSSMNTVYSVIESHGGTVKLISRENAGTIVKFLIPTSDDTVPLSELGNTEDPAPVTRENLILVAEDDEMVLSLVRAALGMRGYKVITARDGEEALALFDQHRDSVALAFIDQTMPKASGRQVYRHIRESHPSLPVILTSGYGREEIPGLNEDEEQYLSFLAKPFPIPEFLDLVRSKLEPTDVTKVSEVL